LAAVLETGDIPQRYYLTAQAASGILRRARNREKKLPPLLEQALEAQAASTVNQTESLEQSAISGTRDLEGQQEMNTTTLLLPDEE
jgi:hypothetical protein